MERWDWRRWTGLVGFVWVVIQVVAIALFLMAGSPPDFGDAKNFAAWINTNSGLLMADAFLTGVATLALLIQFTGLRSIISSAGEDWEWASALFFGAGLVTAAVLVIGSAAEATAVFVSGSGTEPTTVRAAWAAAQILFTFLYLPAAIVFGTVAYSVLRARILPRWVAWLSAVCAVLELIAALTIFGGTGSNGPIGLLPLLLGSTPVFVWFVAVSAVLVRGTRQAN